MTEMQWIAISASDGSLAISQMVAALNQAEIEATVAKIADANGFTVKSWRRIAPQDVPSDRIFRNAWRDEGGRIAVDMPVAREMHLAAIRRRRDALLRKKDGDWVAAFGRGDAKASEKVESEKQALRDVPATVAGALRAAATPDELKAVWPSVLG